MKQPKYSIGIDISSESFTVCASSKPGISIQDPVDYENNTTGFKQLTAWFKSLKMKPANMIICMEATGVYGELLCHYLYDHGYTIAVDPPLKVKRAFKVAGHKTDAVDSLQIAEYAIRFYDSLNIWEPRDAVVEKVKVMLTTRELLVRHRTAQKNARTALKRKKVILKSTISVLEKEIESLTMSIKDIEKNMSDLISFHPQMRQVVDILKTIPGVQELLASNILVLTNGFKQNKSGKELASYIRIAPFKFESGKSVQRKAKSPKHGPAIPRKLLHLAARSITTHDPRFRKYYLQKQLEGKDTYLIYNNVANKLLKIMCAMIRDQKPYSEKHTSINPKYLNYALQKS
jgi:transposase